MRTFVDVHDFLAERDATHEIVHSPAASTSAGVGVRSLDVPLAELAKSLLFRLDGRPTLILVPGDRTVEPERVKALTHCRDLALVRPTSVREVTGYDVGAVPSRGLATRPAAIVDETVLAARVVCRGGLFRDGDAEGPQRETRAQRTRAWRRWRAGRRR